MRDLTMRRLALLALCVLPAAALAKDMPRPKAADKTTGCEWAGPGFTKLEGSDTCLKLGGAVRAEFSTRRTDDILAPAH